MNKVIILASISLATTAYIYYNELSVGVIDVQKPEQIHGKDEIELNKKTVERCGKNISDCMLSRHLVTYVSDLIKKNGLEEMVKYMRQHKDEFVTSKGDYVWVHTWDKKKDIIRYEYHHFGELDGKTASQAQVLVKNCPIDVCNIKKIDRDISIFCDEHGEGFFEYTWIDPKTRDVILKRSFVKKIGDGIYMGSGANVTTRSNTIDVISMLILVLGLLMFLSLWYTLGITGIFREEGHETLIIIMFTVVLLLFMINIVKSTSKVNTLDSERQVYNHINSVATSITGLTLGLCILSTKFKIGDSMSEYFKLLSVAFTFGIVAVVGYKTEIKAKDFKRITELKSMLLINSMAFVIICMLYMYVKIANKKIDVSDRD